MQVTDDGTDVVHAELSLDHNELILRMVEAATGMTRPDADANVVIEHMPPGLYEMYAKAAEAAVLYFAEQLSKSETVVGRVEVRREFYE